MTDEEKAAEEWAENAPLSVLVQFGVLKELIDLKEIARVVVRILSAPFLAGVQWERERSKEKLREAFEAGREGTYTINSIVAAPDFNKIYASLKYRDFADWYGGRK